MSSTDVAEARGSARVQPQSWRLSPFGQHEQPHSASAGQQHSLAGCAVPCSVSGSEPQRHESAHAAGEAARSRAKKAATTFCIPVPRYLCIRRPSANSGPAIPQPCPWPGPCSGSSQAKRSRCRERYWPCGFFLTYYREQMRVALLVLLSIAVATAPAVPAMACVQPPAGASEAESCCCGADAVACSCGCSEDDTSKSDEALDAEQACLCGEDFPQNREAQSSESDRGSVRLAACVAVARHDGQQKRGLTRAVDIPRKYPHPEVRPPLLI